MDDAGAVAMIPEHVPRDRVRDFNIYSYDVDDADFPQALLKLRQPGEPETFWSPHNGGHWVVTRAATIDAVVNDAERFSNRYVGIPKALNPTRLFRPLQIDPPEQVKYRMLVAEALSPRVVATLREDARRLTVGLIEGFRARGECDFVVEFAQHMPIGIFMSIVGVPGGDRLPLLAIAEKIARPTSDAERMQGYVELDAYALGMINERRGGSGDDFVSYLCRSTLEGEPIPEDELIGIISLVRIAGLDTVSGALGFFARFLARNPDRRRELRDDPALINGAVEELLRRYATPLMAREVRCDLELDGVSMRKGDMVTAPLVLHNIDDAEFEDPLHVDFRRPRKPSHITFGGQAHRCLGAMLARTELQIFLAEWLARIPEFSIRPGCELAVRTRVTSIMPSLPLVWDPA